MKTFEFSLERVREWRDERVQLEESRLEHLYGELRGIEARRSELEASRTTADRGLLQAASVTAEQLRSLDEFRRYVRAQRLLLVAETADCERRIEEQRLKVIEVRRQFRLLDRLKAKKFALWQADFNRDIENHATEAYLAKWKRKVRAVRLASH